MPTPGRSRLPLAFALVLVAAVVSPARAQNDSETVGFTPNHTFIQGYLGESIDALSGNLMLDIPIGPEYRTSSTFGYRLNLHYNSKIWDYVGSAGRDFAAGQLRGESQFGLGWTSTSAGSSMAAGTRTKRATTTGTWRQGTARCTRCTSTPLGQRPDST